MWLPLEIAGCRSFGPVAEFIVTVPAFRPEELGGEWDTILLAVKGQDTSVAARALRQHLSASGTAVSLQNGLAAWDAAEVIGHQRIVAASINFAGDWLEPGCIRFGARGALAMGELDGRMTLRLDRLAELLKDFEPGAHAVANVRDWIWGKLVFTAMLIAQAIGQGSIVECFSRPELMPLWRRLGSEMCAIATSAGVRPHAFDAFDPLDYTEAVPEARTRDALAAVVNFTRQGMKMHSGMWRDLAADRRTEVGTQMGAVIAVAQRHGTACKTLTRLVGMVEDIECGRRSQNDANLLELMEA